MQLLNTFLLVFLLVYGAACIANVGQSNVNCSTGMIFNEITPFLLSGDYILTSARDSYSSSYSFKVHPFLIDRVTGACTEYSYPTFNLPTHAESQGDLTGIDLGWEDDFNNGSEVYNDATSTWAVTCCGFKLDKELDKLYFVHSVTRGAASITGYLDDFDYDKKDASFGLMIREKLSGDARAVSMVAMDNAGKGRTFVRSVEGAKAIKTDVSVSPLETYYRLVINGEKIIVFSSIDGTVFTQITVETFESMSSTAYLGIICGGDHATDDSTGYMAKVMIDGYVPGDNFVNYFLPITADYTPAPFLFLPGLGKLVKMMTNYSQYVDHKVWGSGFSNAIHTVFTYSDATNDRCAWFFIQYESVMHAVKEISLSVSSSFDTIESVAIPTEAVQGKAVVDKSKKMAYIGMVDASLMIVDINDFLLYSTFTMEFIENFFVIADYLVGDMNFESYFLVHYGPIIIAYDIATSPADYVPVLMLFASSGTPSELYVDNEWRGVTPGDGPAPIFASVHNGDVTVQMSLSDSIPPIASIIQALDPVALPLSASVVSSNNSGYVLTGSYGQLTYEISNVTLMEYSIYDCAQYSTCETCITDDVYCGWCLTSMKCQPYSAECATTPLYRFEDLYGCPTLVDLTPSSIPSNVGRDVVLTGTLYADWINDLSCNVDGGFYVGTDKNRTHITCSIPPLLGGSHDIFLTYNGSNYTSEGVVLEAFECSNRLTCESCTGVIGCGWEYGSVSCNSSGAISTNYTTASSGCPSIIGSTPSSSTEVGGGTIELAVSNMYPPNTGSFMCSFIEIGGPNVANSTGTYVNTSLVTCSVPTVALSGADAYYKIMLYFVNDSVFYDDSYASFLYYTCVNSFSCGECVDSGFGKDCAWCYQSDTCIPTNGECEPQLKVVGSCPEITATSPESSYYAVKTNVSLEGSNFPEDYLFYNAWFNATGYAKSFSVEWKDNTSLSIVNADVAAATTGNLTIFLNTTVVAQYQDFVFYECTQFTQCSSCVGGYDLCGWCYVDGCGYYENACGTTMLNDTCPVLYSVEPAMGLKDMNTPVVVKGSYFPNISTYSIRVVDESDPYAINGTSCTLVDSQTLNCTVPASNKESVAVVYLLIDDDYFVLNSTLTFTYYKCSKFTTCKECLALPACSYCHFGTCVEKAIVSTVCGSGTNIETCPELQLTSPDSLNITGGVDVTLNGTFELPLGYDYPMFTICSIGTTYFSGHVADNNSIVCHNVPAFAGSFTGSQYYQNVTMRVTINSLDFMETTLQYFDCEATELQTGCGTCLDRAKTSSMCGYCYSDWKCSELSDCGTAGSFVNDVCPSITGASVSFADALIPIPISYSGVNLPLYAAGNVYCDFGSNVTAATVSSPSQLSCFSPMIMDQSSVIQTVYPEVKVGGKVYVSSSIGLEMLDCHQNSVQNMQCSTCSNKDARCGWCSNVSNNTDACTTVFGCVPSLWADTAGTCPSILGTSNSIFYVNGGHVLFFYGTMMFDTEKLFCVFTATASTLVKTVQATVVNATHSYCITPSWTLKYDGIPETVTFTVEYANRTFAEGYSGSITMIPVPKEAPPPEGFNPWFLVGGGVSTGFIVIFLILLIIVIIIVFIIVIVIIMVRFSRKGRRKLKKPNYMAITFGNDDKQKFSPSTKETRTLRYLEDIILEYEDTSFLNEIIAHVEPEETDLFCKHLIYLLLPMGHAKVLSVLQALFKMELKASVDEATLFRMNSMTTKMFAKYARIVGFDFLWDALALFIDDINYKFTDEERKNKNEEVLSLTSASMEIDPTKVQDEDVDFMAANTYQLLLTLTNLFRRFTRISHQFPVQLSFFLKLVFQDVEEKYPGEGYKSVGGFIFLRWICPAIFGPQAFGISPKPPSREANRMLVLIAKTVQNISNQTYPGKKEDFMGKIDEFIRANIPVCERFVDAVTTVDDISMDMMDAPKYRIDVPKSAYTNSLVWFYNFVLSKPDFLEGYSDLKALFGKHAQPIY